MSSVSTLLRQGQIALAESSSPLIDVQILLCHVLEVDRSYLYMAPEETVPAIQENEFRTLIAQRQIGTPISHLTGRRDFWSLNLKVNEHTLIPRPETEHLVEAALSIIQKGQVSRIADLGTGSGAIALAIGNEIESSFPRCQIIATDISEEALLIAAENLKTSKLKNVSLKQGRWCEAFDADAKFDLIVSNPPYVAEGHHLLDEGDVRFEPQLALTSGRDGLDAIREIIQTAPDNMQPNAWLMFEHGYDQKQAIQQLFLQRGFQAIETTQDYANLDRVTIGQWP